MHFKKILVFVCIFILVTSSVIIRVDASDTYDTVDGNITDIDSSIDIGNETNFINAQDTSPDSDYMNIQENNTGSGAVNEWLENDADATDLKDATHHGSTIYLATVDTNNFLTIDKGNGYARWYTFGNTVGGAGTYTVNMSVYFISSDGNDDLYWEVDTSGDDSGEYTGTFLNPGVGWNTFSVGSLSQAEVNSARAMLKGIASGQYVDPDIDAVKLGVSKSDTTNYKIDFEYDWSNAFHDEDNEKVCFYVHAHTGSEDLNVSYWTGGAWSDIGDITSTGWTNLTAIGLTSSSYTIRLNGLTESSDTTQDDWDIDCIFLHTWSIDNTVPIQSNQKIWNSTTSTEWNLNASDVSLTPTSFNITIADIDADNMNITILTNESGSWTVVNQSSGVGLTNSTVSYYNTSWIDAHNSKYWISFNVTDGTDWCNETYHFTTATWWNSNWDYFKTITIDSSYIDTDLVDFPVLVVIDSTTGAKCNDGASIRFLDTDNITEYSFDIDEFNSVATSFVWVKVPRIDSSSDTVFLMYYGNSGASNASDGAGTWNSKHIAVWHHKEDPSVSIIDSSGSNWHNGTAHNMDSNDIVTGKIGKGLDYDGANDYVDVTDHSDFSPTGHSIYMWAKPNLGGASTNFLFSKEWQTGSYEKEYSLNIDDSAGNLEYSIVGSSNYIGRQLTSGATTVDGHWNQLVCTWDGGQYISGCRIYVNGTNMSCTTYGTDPLGTYSDKDPDIGIATDLYTPEDTYNYPGILDEVRFYNCEINASWIKACFNSENQTSTFLTFGSEQVGPGINQPPVNSNPAPSNGATGVNIDPYLNITANDPEGDTMNITKSTNASGSWTDILWLNNTGNTTMSNTTSGIFTNYDTKYWWNVSTNDGMDGWDNDTYYFTTKSIATSVDTISPYEQTSSPLWINATGNSDLDNVTLWYRNSTDNSTWNPDGFGIAWEHASTNTSASPPYLDYPNDADVMWHNDSTICAYICVIGATTRAGIIQIINVTNPAKMTPMDYHSDSSIMDGAHDIDVIDYDNYGRVAFVVSYWDGELSSWNVSNPWNIVAMDNVDNVSTENAAGAGMYTDIDEDNKILYLTSKTMNTVYSYNISDPNNLVFLDSIITNITIPWHPHVNTNNSNYLYVACEGGGGIGGVVVYDVTDPSNMIPLNNSIWRPNYCLYIMQSGNYLFTTIYTVTAPVAQPDRSLFIMDVTDSTNLTNVSVTQVNGYCPLIDTVAYRNQEYLFSRRHDGTNDKGISIVNITDKSSPTMAGTIPDDVGYEIENCHWMNVHYNNISDHYVLYAIGYTADSFTTFNLSFNTTQGGWSEWGNASNPDSTYPWKWNFTFPNSTGYYEFYSMGNKSGNTNETAPAVKDAMCNYTSTPWSNTAPTLTSEIPTNTSSDISKYPQLNITVTDADGNNSNVYWYTNASDSWYLMQTNTTVLNATVYLLNFTNASAYSTKYWWRVSANDTHDNTTETYHFTTESAPSAPVQSSESPINGSIDVSIIPELSITVNDADADSMDIYWRSNSTSAEYSINDSYLPCLVAETKENCCLRMPFERNVGYANGRFWVFYVWYNGGVSDYNRSYVTSEDGITWTDPQYLCGSRGGADFSMWINHTDNKIHYVYAYAITAQGGTTTPYYRKGNLNSNGTVTWDAPEQNLTDPLNYWNWTTDPNICVDVHGYPWITYHNSTCEGGENPGAWVTKSSTKDGTWTPTSGFPYELKPGSPWLPMVVPLENGSVYVIYGHSSTGGDDQTIYGKLWDGDSWGANETVSTTEISETYFGKFVAVAVGNDVHVAFQNVTESIIHVKRDGTTGSWGSEYEIQADTVEDTTPVITKTENDDVIVIWGGKPTVNHTYYKVLYSNDTWSSTVDWFYDPAMYDDDVFTPYQTSSVSYEAHDGKIGYVYRINRSGLDPFGVNFTWLNITGDTAWQTFGTNMSVNNGTYRQTNSNFSEYSTKYWWSVNLTDGTNWTNATYHFTTKSNTAPTQSAQKIWNSTTSTEWNLNTSDVSLTPTSFNITIADIDADKMNITILTNESGSWTVVNQSSGVGLTNSTVSYYNTSWIDTVDTTYYVAFNLTDGTDWTNETFWFTTTYVISISINVSDYDFGTQDTNVIVFTNETDPNFFGITNDGNVDIDLKIQATNMTNVSQGYEWNLSDTPSTDQYALACSEDGASWHNISRDATTFYTDLSASNTISIDMRLKMPITITAGHGMDCTVTITAIKH